MIPWFKKLLWDQSAFERYGRTLILIVGGSIATGQFSVPDEYTWIGVIIMGVAGMIGAGEMNVPIPPKRRGQNAEVAS